MVKLPSSKENQSLEAQSFQLFNFKMYELYSDFRNSAPVDRQKKHREVQNPELEGCFEIDLVTLTGHAQSGRMTSHHARIKPT